MKIMAIIQARMGSSRLPGKVLMNLCDKPVLWHIVNRIQKSWYINSIIIATSINREDDAIEQFAVKNNINVYRGNQTNVLERFYKCAKQYNPDIIVRLTGDNALIDPHIADQGIEYFISKKGLDYVYYREGLPLGMAVEIFSSQALEKAYAEAKDAECLEHVTPYMYLNQDKFKSERIHAIGKDRCSLRWTLDTRQDYELLTRIYEALYAEGEDLFYYEDILEEYQSHEEWMMVNSGIRQVGLTYKGDGGK